MTDTAPQAQEMAMHFVFIPNEPRIPVPYELEIDFIPPLNELLVDFMPRLVELSSYMIKQFGRAKNYLRSFENKTDPASVQKTLSIGEDQAILFRKIVQIITYLKTGVGYKVVVGIFRSQQVRKLWHDYNTAVRMKIPTKAILIELHKFVHHNYDYALWKLERLEEDFLEAQDQFPFDSVHQELFTFQRRFAWIDRDLKEVLVLLIPYHKTKAVEIVEQQFDEVDSPPDVCAICREKEYTDPRMIQCGHIFCLECISDWFKEKHTCPSCRRSTRDCPLDL